MRLKKEQNETATEIFNVASSLVPLDCELPDQQEYPLERKIWQSTFYVVPRLSNFILNPTSMTEISQEYSEAEIIVSRKVGSFFLGRYKEVCKNSSLDTVIVVNLNRPPITRLNKPGEVVDSVLQRRISYSPDVYHSPVWAELPHKKQYGEYTSEEFLSILQDIEKSSEFLYCLQK